MKIVSAESENRQQIMILVVYCHNQLSVSVYLHLTLNLFVGIFPCRKKIRDIFCGGGPIDNRKQYERKEETTCAQY